MKYKLRAECIMDITRIIDVAGVHMNNFKMDKHKDLPDAEFEFDIDLELSEIIAILKNIPDSHVMYETVKPIEEYTGIRE